MVLLVARSADIFRLGTKLFRSASDVTASRCKVSALSAVTASGTSWRFSTLRRAVTTISASPLESAAPAAAAVWARAAPNGSNRIISRAGAASCVTQGFIVWFMITPANRDGLPFSPVLLIGRIAGTARGACFGQPQQSLSEVFNDC